MYKRICCPIDGSDTAQRGLAEAIRLAADQGAQLCLVHVLDQGVMTTYTPLVQDVFIEFRRAAHGILEEARTLAADQGLEAETQLVEIFTGRAGPAIAEAAQAMHADLIVMGTHGRRALERLMLGSDAIAVIGGATVPVLLVK